MRPRIRKPTTPGELLTDMLSELGVSTRDFALHIDEIEPRLDEIFNGCRRIDAQLARKFGGAFAQSPEFWLNAQLATDVWTARNNFEQTPVLPCVHAHLMSSGFGDDLADNVLVK